MSLFSQPMRIRMCISRRVTVVAVIPMRYSCTLLLQFI